MAKIDWTRHRYSSTLDRDYYSNPKTGFDQIWHDKQTELKKQKTQANLAEQRNKIQALRKNST
tara:strand:- start:2894 stop:3082 length:189 start_codon:yes stop_codon:yes gene_type:complete